MPRRPTSIRELSVGAYYEDCAFHPCLCIGTDPEHGSVHGISLVDGSFPRTCDINHCGVRILTPEEAITWRFQGPLDLPPEVEFQEDAKWWTQHAEFAAQYWPRSEK